LKDSLKTAYEPKANVQNIERLGRGGVQKLLILVFLGPHTKTFPRRFGVYLNAHRDKSAGANEDRASLFCGASRSHPSVACLGFIFCLGLRVGVSALPGHGAKETCLYQ